MISSSIIETNSTANNIFKIHHHRWFQLALLYFIVAGFLGVLMRYAHVGDLPEWIDYRNIRHAHSHIALLGWLYGGLYILIVVLFGLDRPIYGRLYWWSQFCVLGMLTCFPIFGYKLYSIVFLVAFIFLTYGFIYLVYRDLAHQKKDWSTLLLKTALFFLFLSSLGTWALALVMNSSLKGSAIYYGTIQFYLHFQFNGWLVFGGMALFFRLLGLYHIPVDDLKAKYFYRLLVISAFLTFAMAITWSTPIAYIFWINSVGVIVQLLALGYFLLLAKGIIPRLKELISKDVKVLLYISFLSFTLKVLIQSFVVIPYIATISYTIRNFVIGFIHLLMLGCLSAFIMAVYQIIGQRNVILSNGIKLFIFAVVLTEILLFVQGLFLWFGLGFVDYYYETIFAVSILMPLGILIYFIRLGFHKKVN